MRTLLKSESMHSPAIFNNCENYQRKSVELLKEPERGFFRTDLGPDAETICGNIRTEWNFHLITENLI